MSNISQTRGTKRGDGQGRNLAPQCNKATPARGVAEAERNTQTSPISCSCHPMAEPGQSQYHGDLQASRAPVPWGPSGIQGAQTREMGRVGQERTRE